MSGTGISGTGRSDDHGERPARAPAGTPARLQAAQFLRELLRREPYRRQWAAFGAQREREVHQVAVAKVLAGYLRAHGDEDAGYAQLTRRVSRALRGDVLSRATLRLFIQAFGISPEHEAVLWRQWQGAELARVIVGGLDPPDEPPPFRTILLHEYHYLGPDGRPQRHRTLRDIQALADEVTSYTYAFDTGELTVERIGGGLPGPPYQRSEHVWAVDIALSRPLRRGDEHSLEFESAFRYAAPPDPCFRRFARERLENVAIRVQFDPARLPRAVWWAQWDDDGDPHAAPVAAQPVALDAEYAVYHRLDVLERAIAGFSWEF
jgi:hypothetical protein